MLLIATTWQDFSFNITWVNAVIQNFFQLTLCFKDCSHTSTWYSLISWHDDTVQAPFLTNWLKCHHHLDSWTVRTSDNTVVSIKRMCIDLRYNQWHIWILTEVRCVINDYCTGFNSVWCIFSRGRSTSWEKCNVYTFKCVFRRFFDGHVLTFKLQDFSCRTSRRKVANFIDWKCWFFQHFNHLSTDGTCSTDNSNCVSHSKTSFGIFYQFSLVNLLYYV